MYKNKISLYLTILMMVGSATFLSGCSGLGKSLGFSKNPPDEFKVVRRAPLTLPPKFSLTPPKKKDPTRPRKEMAESAHSIMIDKQGEGDLEKVFITKEEREIKTKSSGASAHVLVSEAKRALPERGDRTHNIRHTVDEEAGIYKPDDKTLVESIMFWDKGSKSGDIIDPEEERKSYKGLNKED